jgi:hypothetical protein
MDLLKRLQEMKPMQLLKIIGAVLVGLLLLTFAFQLISSSFKSITRDFGWTMDGMTMGSGYGGSNESYAVSQDAAMPALSARNVAGSIAPRPSSPTGDTAEEFEVTQYNAHIETRRLQGTCDAVAGLKVREDVIFDNSNSYDRGCSFTFKVKHASVEEIVAFIKELNPRDFSENSYTIKRQIDDFTGEVEVLQKKRASIDATLASALNAYDEVTRLATNSQNADALAKIIDSRIGIIERLTQERININEQLDRLARAKADQLDRLDYTYFSVSVQENKYIDGESLKDSWKQTLRDFVMQVNKVIQDVTVNLILLLFFIAQWALYAVIVLVVVKYGWALGKGIWKR